MDKKQLTTDEIAIVEGSIRAIEKGLPTGYGKTVEYQPVVTLEPSLSREMTEEIRWYFRNRGWDIPRANLCENGWKLTFRGRYLSG